MRRYLWLLISLLLLALAPGAGATLPPEMDELYWGWYNNAQAFEPVTGTDLSAVLTHYVGQAPAYNPGDRPLTRQEVAVMAVQAMGRDGEGRRRDGLSLILADASAVDPQLRGYVEVAVAAGLLEAPWTIRPEEHMTRREASELVWQAMGARARSNLPLKAGQWQPAEPLSFCATPDTRPLRTVVEPIATRLPEESSTVTVYLHNHTNICGQEGKPLAISPNGWQLQIYPFLSTYADVGRPLAAVDLPAPPAELAPGERVTLTAQIGGGLAPGWYTAALVKGAAEGPGQAFTGVLPIDRNQAFYWQNFLVTRSQLNQWDAASRDDRIDGIAKATYGEYVEFAFPEGVSCTPIAATASGQNFTTLLPRQHGTRFGPVPGETDRFGLLAQCGEIEAMWRFAVAPIAKSR